MRIILTTDVPKVGNRYEIKDLKDGYANTLLARGVALLATPKNLADLEKKKSEIKKKKDEEVKIFESLIASINNKVIKIKVRANDKGHLFKSVSSLDIIKAIKDETGISVEENAIITRPIKELGSHIVEIKKGDKKGNCEIIVEKE